MSELDLSAFSEEIPPECRDFVINNLESWINQTVIDSCRAFAIAAGVHQRYLDAIKLVKISDWRYKVELDYFGPKGEPLGVWFEFGTKAHIIEAVIADFLRWIDKITGKPRFAKRVRHPGTKPLLIMTRGARHGMPRLKSMIISRTNQHMGGIHT